MSDDQQHSAAEQSSARISPAAEPEQTHGKPTLPMEWDKPATESASPQGEDAAVQAGDVRPADPRDPADVLTHRLPGHEAADAAVLAESRRHTRRAFLGFGIAIAAGYGVYRHLDVGPQDEMVPGALRKAFNFNASVSRDILRDKALAPTYPLSRAETLRINGVYGLKKDLVLDSWRLQMVGVRNDKQHPRYVADVTAWDYKYKAAASNEDKGHDTKVDPSKDKGTTAGGDSKQGGQPKGQGNAPPSNGPMPPEQAGKGAAPSQAAKGAPPAEVGKGAQPQGAPPPSGAPQTMQQRIQAMADAATQVDPFGRKGPRGSEEAGESDSTLDPGTPGLLLQMSDLDHFPRYDLVTQFKCIEGWSQIVHWKGIRMADFMDAYPPDPIDGKEPRYVYMETPDGDYYVGYDLHVLRHPQTLLVTEMMGQPLTQNHGAPLRLHTPLKYGYKQIKRIALITYGNDKPDDYWTKLGYDWYAGL